MGVDLMTGFRGSKAAGWVRNIVVALGLTVLLALAHDPSGNNSRSPEPGYAARGGAAAFADSNHAEHSALAQSPLSGLPAAPRLGPANPGPSDETHPANRKQTSLVQAAGTEHPLKDRSPARQGPPPTLRGKVLPSQVHAPGGNGVGGCLREYGENGQCVPVVPPSMAGHLRDMADAGISPSTMEHRWSCSELRKYFPDGAAVRRKGVDPQRLDTDRDGRACDAGDD